MEPLELTLMVGVKKYNNHLEKIVWQWLAKLKLSV